MHTELIPTFLGPTPVYREGSGPPVVVIHGGPGFGHGYLVEPLRFLSEHRELVFFDQPGCGDTPTPDSGPSPDVTFRHTARILEAVSGHKPVGVIAHSWGALVLAGALANSTGTHINLSEGLLINPTALDRKGYEAARKNLKKRISIRTKLKVLGALLKQSDGAQIMNLLMPHYVADSSNDPLPSVTLDLSTYKLVDSNLGNFDFSCQLSALEQLTVIRGEKDFTTPAEIHDVLFSAKQHLSLPDAGHFPFIETPNQFSEAALNAFLV